MLGHSHLDEHLGIRKFRRTSRSPTLTGQGQAFNTGTCKTLYAADGVKAQVFNMTQDPKVVPCAAAAFGFETGLTVLASPRVLRNLVPRQASSRIMIIARSNRRLNGRPFLLS